MNYDPDILSRFKSAYDRDKANYIKDWIVRWRYVDVHKPQTEFYSEESLYNYTGTEELIKWFGYNSCNEKPDYFPEDTMQKLCKKSKEKDQMVIESLGLCVDWDVYDRYIGRYNAQDFLLPNFYPVPERYKPTKVLDFGAGFGRQANLWVQEVKDVVYTGMDAIPNSYCIQHLYYSHLGVNFYDYVCDAPFSFNKPGIYHLPTWRHDLLPDHYFDLVICTQVLSEINGRLAKHMINCFRRILKPGGALLVRDPGPLRHKSGNKVNIDQYIDSCGFSLEFRPYIVDHQDLHSFPRIWRKKYDEAEASKTEDFSVFRELNYLSGGKLKSITNKIKGR